MVSGVTPATAALIAQLRSALTNLPTPKAREQTQRTQEQAPEPRPGDMASALAQRLRRIDPNDPDRRRKALRIFLETLFLEEWGSQLLNDPSFHQLVSQVQQELEQQPALVPMVDAAVQQLTA